MTSSMPSSPEAKPGTPASVLGLVRGVIVRAGIGRTLVKAKPPGNRQVRCLSKLQWCHNPAERAVASDRAYMTAFCGIQFL